jgi:hypothetical protein
MRKALERLGSWPGQVALVLALASAAVGAVWAHAYREGRAAAHREGYRQRTDTVRVLLRQLDTVYRADTVRLWRLVRQVDTLVRVDSIPVIAADSARADSALRVTTTALRACVSSVLTCEQRAALEHRLRLAAESALAAPPGRPSLRTRARDAGAGALAGAALVLFLRR